MELTKKQKQKINKVAKKYQLNLIVLFGSRATGKIHEKSDFDVAYLPKKNLGYDDENNINSQFTNIFKYDRVDSVNIKKAPPLLLFGIFNECQVLFTKDNLIFPTYRTYAFKKYFEMKPFLEKILVK
jgi:uncharacterized protein